jgi:hypothetical protein
MVTMATLEIYNEEIFDLLKVRDRGLPIRRDKKGNVHVQGLSEVNVRICIVCVCAFVFVCADMCGFALCAYVHVAATFTAFSFCIVAVRVCHLVFFSIFDRNRAILVLAGKIARFECMVLPQ